MDSSVRYRINIWNWFKNWKKTSVILKYMYIIRGKFLGGLHAQIDFLK